MKNKCYYKDGSVLDCYDASKQLHKEDGPAIEWADGGAAWYVNDKSHRIDGPAIEYANGDKHWYINGKRHRLDGPAIEWSNSSDKWWFIDGNCLTEEEFNNHPKVQHYKFQLLLEEVLSEG